MIILGLDPGFATTGYGLLQKRNNQLRTLDFGCIITTPDETHITRLLYLYNALEQLLNKVKPDVVAMEKLFFNQNTKTALQVGEARGVIILGIAKKGKPFFEYTPLQVKQAVTGYGRASKVQVQKMVQSILNLPGLPTPDDAADALAVAICQSQSHCFQEAVERYVKIDD